MALSAQQMTQADVLALRIILGQLIVRIAAGAPDPAAVLKIMRDSSVKTASGAKLRGMSAEQQDEVRKHVEGSIDRFYSSMHIEKGPAPAGAGAPAAAQPAAPRPAQRPAAPAPQAMPAKAPPAAKPAAVAPKAAPKGPEPKKK